jgi:hypothetical protein
LESLILKNGFVVDPINNVLGIHDLGIYEGKIDSIKENIDPDLSSEVIDLNGKIVMPGHIDTHAHLSSIGGDTWGEDRSYGHKMIAESGTTTVLDLAGNPLLMIEGMKKRGAGLNVACITGLQPGITIPSEEPKIDEIRDVVYKEKKNGAIGLKIVGGYHPFSSEITSDIIFQANNQQAWIALHVGTKDAGSNILGLRDVPNITDKGRLHVAHINSYARGLINTVEEESNEALNLINKMRNQWVTEAYLAQINGTNGLCNEDGDLVFNVAINCMVARGYEPNEKGIRNALKDGYGSALVMKEGRMILVSGEDAVEIWESNLTNQALCFPVNSPISAFMLTTSKYSDGEFIIDAISTDGGALPRNVAIEKTMSLVNFGALSLDDAVMKLSYNPSRMLGLENRGHFTEGAEADITIIDQNIGKAVMSFVKGKMIMKDGISLMNGGNWLILSEGKELAEKSGLPFEILDLSKSKLYL